MSRDAQGRGPLNVRGLVRGSPRQGGAANGTDAMRGRHSQERDDGRQVTVISCVAEAVSGAFVTDAISGVTVLYHENWVH